MPDRATDAAAFLDRAGWTDATRAPLSGDASDRRYERIVKGRDSAVLMDVGPSGGDTLAPFIRISDHLNHVGLSAPQIISADAPNGFLLLEDFGDDLFARLIAADPGRERPLYEAAIEALCRLHAAPLPGGLPAFSTAELTEFAMLPYDWYLPEPHTDGKAYSVELARLLTLFEGTPPVLALRDFHSENMIWLPDRQGVRRVGLLDFQDAFLCHPAYDLVSLLRDARRNITPSLAPLLIHRYIDRSGCDANELALAIAVYGAQRNLRILGVFARLSRLYGKPHYVDLIPRVWQHLMTDLSHPALQDLRRIVLSDFPEPAADNLTALKVKCTITPDL